MVVAPIGQSPPVPHRLTRSATADPATHLGYLVTSVALLPLLTARPGAARELPASAPRSTAAVAALACAATTVVVVRLHATWAGAA